jgi:hypothetical protein
MRYGIAIAVSLLLILGMFGYVKYMDVQEQQWKAAGVTLPATAIIAMSIARLIHNYWYIFLTFFVAIPMAIASFFHTEKNDDVCSNP